MSEVTLADLKGDMYELAISIGVEQTLELCSLFAGDNIYIPLSGKEINGDILELKEILGQELFERMQMTLAARLFTSPPKVQYCGDTLPSEYGRNMTVLIAGV